jgi:hypothetical protein
VSSAARGVRYARFLGLAIVAVVALLAVGYLPTRRLAGDAAVPAMAAGCLVSLVSAAMAALVLVAMPADTPTARMQRASLAMTVRLAVVVLLGAAAVFSGGLARAPLLFWLAASYVALLPFEVRLAITPE